MIIQWFDIAGAKPRAYHYEEYETDKQRAKLLKRAKEDAQNSPAARLWVVDVTSNGIRSFALEEA